MYWLLVILILVPHIASAECDWVLWLKIDRVHNPPAKNVEIGQWNQNAAFDTRKECINAMARSHSIMKAAGTGTYTVNPPEPLLMDNKMVMRLAWPKWADLHDLECWPSEIKPK